MVFNFDIIASHHRATPQTRYGFIDAVQQTQMHRRNMMEPRKLLEGHYSSTQTNDGSNMVQDGKEIWDMQLPKMVGISKGRLEDRMTSQGHLETQDTQYSLLFESTESLARSIEHWDSNASARTKPITTRTTLQKPIQPAPPMKLNATSIKEKGILAATALGLMNASRPQAPVPVRQEYSLPNPILPQGDQLSSNLRPWVSTRGHNDTPSGEVTREEPAFISPNVPTTGLLNVLSNYNHFDIGP